MMTTTDSTFDTFVDELERADAIARATDCGVDGCDRRMHDGTESPQEWHHRVGSDADDVLLLDLLVNAQGRAYAHVLADFTDETYAEIDGDALRALADKIEAEPEKLRALADRLDRLNTAREAGGLHD